ncbi:chromosome transmission fidelity protein 1 [Nematocida parisii]|nr:chromosome transmission fidelity protein 1 [Nematocida parisii]
MGEIREGVKRCKAQGGDAFSEKLENECREFIKKCNLPYVLYKGQKDFITDATEIISKSALGILESPTGTGKTLSSLITAIKYVGNSVFDSAGISKDNMELLKSLYNRTNKRVIYACRTHSQLEQVIKELEELNTHGTISVKGVVLGSRRHTCINSIVRSSKDINNMCRISVKDKKCSFYNNLQEGKHHAVRKQGISIEDALSMGSSCGVCPHFYLKQEAKSAGIIVLPYSLFLQKDFFNELGIQMNESVLIIDEAHNLFNAVLEEYSVCVSESEVTQILPHYVEYMNRQEGKYKVDLLELFIFISGICEYFKKSCANQAEEENKIDLFNINRFLIDSELDHINLLEITERMDRFLPSKIFPIRREDVENQNEAIFRRICKLARLLGECDKHSYIVKQSGKLSFRNIYPSDYLSYFEDIKSILAIGGTLTHSSDLSLLFNREVIRKSYPSICKNVYVALCSDYSFVYSERDKEIIRAFNLALQYYKKIESGGVLLFVQSKSIMLKLKTELEKKSANPACLLFESYTSIQEYKRILSKEKKVIMVCVMGGNFSEGINFKHEMCRVLIICGIPLPKPTEETLLIQKKRGEEYFIDKGMQAVNQTIGRSIRTKDDYSCVLLLDKRFIRYRHKLSQWAQPYITEIKSTDTTDILLDKLSRWSQQKTPI